MGKGITQYPIAYTTLTSIVIIAMLTLVALNALSKVLIEATNQIAQSGYSYPGNIYDYRIFGNRVYVVTPCNYSDLSPMVIYINSSSIRSEVLVERGIIGGLKLWGPLNLSYDKIIVIIYYEKNTPIAIDVFSKNNLRNFSSSLMLDGEFPPSITLNVGTGDLTQLTGADGRYKYSIVEPSIPPIRRQVIKTNMTYMLNKCFLNLTPINMSRELLVNNNSVSISFSDSLEKLYRNNDTFVLSYGRIKYIDIVSTSKKEFYDLTYDKDLVHNITANNYYFYISETRVIGTFNVSLPETYNELIFNITHELYNITLKGTLTNQLYYATVAISYNIHIINSTADQVFACNSLYYLDYVSRYKKNIVIRVILPENISDVYKVRIDIEYSFYISNPSNENVFVYMVSRVRGNYINSSTIRICALGQIKILSSGGITTIHPENYSAPGIFRVVIKQEIGDNIDITIYSGGSIIYNGSASSLTIKFVGPLIIENTTYLLPDIVVDTNDLIIQDLNVEPKALTYTVNKSVCLFTYGNKLVYLTYVVPGVISIGGKQLFIYNTTSIIVDQWFNRTYLYHENANTTIVNGSHIGLLQNIVASSVEFNTPMLKLRNLGEIIRNPSVLVVVNITYIDGDYSLWSMYGGTYADNAVNIALKPKPIRRIFIKVHIDSSGIALYISDKGIWFLLAEGVVVASSKGLVVNDLDMVTILLEQYIVFNDVMFPALLSANPLLYIDARS